MPDTFEGLATKRLWSPRSHFGVSTPFDQQIFARGDGIFLMTNPNRGEGDPVRAIGWAESDYWALRAWLYPIFRGDLTLPPAQWKPSPSLTFLGRPKSLNFKDISAFERARPGARKATLVSARYRMTDGAFLSVNVNGTNGVTYMYASTKPAAADEPVAFEIKLQKGP